MKTIELAKSVFAHLEASVPEISHYPGLLSLFGALKTAEAGKDEAFMQKTLGLLARFPDQVTHGHYNFPNYRIGGIARAYALFRGYMTDDKTRTYVREAAEELMEAPRNRDGIIKGPWATARNVIWIDNAMAVTPFLLYAGLTFHQNEWVNEAAKQTLMMYDVFRNPANGLLHQSKDEIAAGVVSADHWGRGNGWGYIALTELLQYLPEQHPERRRVEEYFGMHSHAMLMCQNAHDVWHQELTDFTSYEEATATGLILYGFGVGLRLDYLSMNGFGEPYRRGINAMCKMFLTPDFAIKNVCPGCRTPGRGREMGQQIAYCHHMPVTDDVHGFGPMLLSLSGACESGISEIDF